MAFWRDQMPTDMFLRSGPDWPLDARGEHTFEAYFEDARAAPRRRRPDPDRGLPRPHRLVRRAEAPRVDQRMVDRADQATARSWPTMEDGSTITADKVLAAPGIAHFAQPARVVRRRAGRPPRATPASWSPSTTSPAPGSRSSAAGRAPTSGPRCCATTGPSGSTSCTGTTTPTFERVSWEFVDPYVDQTLAERGWWRDLPAERQQAIALEFWQVGRLTLEHWLVAAAASRCGHQPAPDRRSRCGGRRGRRAGHASTLTDGQRLDRRPRGRSPPATAPTSAAVPYLSGSSTGSRSPTASPTSAPASRPRWPGSTSPASPRPATSGRSTASPRAARPRPRSRRRDAALNWPLPAERG